MTVTLGYLQLESEDVVARFRRDGLVTIRLPERHATACAALIETCRVVQQRGARPGLFRRAQALVRGWAVTVRIVMFHSRLMELTSLLVLQESECVRTRDQNGDHVFRFTRR